MLNENILKTWKVVIQIREQQKESNEAQKDDGKSCFNFRFFKVRKTSFIITILGLLVFILTLFCMKQQNDYSLLMNEYHKQDIVIRESDRELKQ
jgi:fumarate reductase subunit C